MHLNRLKQLVIQTFLRLVSGMGKILSPHVPSDTWSLLPRWLRRTYMRLNLVQVWRFAQSEYGGAQILERVHAAKGVDPIADAFAGANVRSDVYAMRDYENALFIIYIGVGTTGTSTIIVNSCDDNTPTTRTPIPYTSRDILATDVQGAITARLAAGYAPVAGSSKIILIEVAAEDLIDGDAFVEIEFDEVDNDPVLGGVLVLLMNGRYKEDVSPTVLA